MGKEPGHLTLFVIGCAPPPGGGLSILGQCSAFQDFFELLLPHVYDIYVTVGACVPQNACERQRTNSGLSLLLPLRVLGVELRPSGFRGKCFYL